MTDSTIMKVAALLCFLCAGAHADSVAEPYFPDDKTLLVKLDDASGELARLVGKAHKGVVRCFDKTDKVVGIIGAGEYDVTGCFVAVRRDGKLAPPPPATKRWTMTHFMPPLNGGLRVEPVGKTGDLAVTISDGTGNAIWLWIDPSAKHDELSLEPNAGMAGKITWEPRFVVGKGGTIRPTATP
jgi:hypothetical protein